MLMHDFSFTLLRIYCKRLVDKEVENGERPFPYLQNRVLQMANGDTYTANLFYLPCAKW